MRRFFFFGLSLLLLAACTKKYIVNTSLDPTFDTKQSYKIAIMPLLVSGAMAPSSFDRDKAYDYLLRRLMETGKLQPADKYAVKQAVGVEEFGQQGTVDASLARQIGTNLGVDLVCLAEIATEQNIIALASVEIYSVSGTSVLYSGSARAANPASASAAAEFALDLATNELVAKMK